MWAGYERADGSQRQPAKAYEQCSTFQNRFGFGDGTSALPRFCTRALNLSARGDRELAGAETSTPLPDSEVFACIFQGGGRNSEDLVPVPDAG